MSTDNVFTRKRRLAPRAGAVIAMALLGASISIGSAAAGVTGPARPLGTNPTSTGTLGPSTPGGPITRAQIIARAEDWINQAVMYSTAQDSGSDWNYWSDSATGGPYRQDCSGFVSMAWGLSSSLATPTLPSVSTVIDSNISGDTNLQPGDALDYTADHVVLFDHWTDSSGHFAYDAEHTEGEATNQKIVSIYDSSLEGYAMSDFEALQYNKLTTPPVPTAPSVSVNGFSTVMSGAITLSASASDSVSSTLSTRFYVDGSAVGSASTGTSPSTSWNTATLAPGAHLISAVTTASNSSGSASSTSSAVQVFTAQAGSVYDRGRSAGGSWDSSATEIDTAGTITAVASAAMPDGTYHVITLVPGYGVYDDHRSATGAEMSLAKIDTTGSITAIAAAALPDGTLHVETLSPGYGVYDRTLSTSGSWSGANNIDINGSIYDVSAVGLTAGTLHVETIA